MNDRSLRKGPDLTDRPARVAGDRWTLTDAARVLDAVRAMTPEQRREMVQLLTQGFAAKDGE